MKFIDKNASSIAKKYDMEDLNFTEQFCKSNNIFNVILL